MKIFIAVAALCVVVVSGEEERFKRQVNYAFPGPRSGASSGRAPSTDRSAPHRPSAQGFQGGFKPFNIPDFGSFQAPSGFGGPPKQEGPPRRAPVAAPRFRPSARQAPRQVARPVSRPIPQAPLRPARRPVARPAPQYERPAPQQQRPVQESYAEENIEEETKIDPLTELLAQSSFNCDGKKSGYYADSSEKVNCQAFHYCADGKKHSWMCQDGQIFHQVHLICVPNSDNDICKKSNDLAFVNDYLYKPVGQEKNVTIYADRFYPDNYSLGDPISVPQSRPAVDQGYGQAPARRQAPRDQYQDQQYAPAQRSRQPARVAAGYRDDSSYYQGEQGY